MDFRKVYEPWEIERNAKALGLDLRKFKAEPWMERGFIDGDNSGSGSLDYGEKWFLFKAVEYYFPGLGFSVSYLSPKGIKGMAGRVAYSDLSRPVHHGPGRGPERRASRAARREGLPRLRLHLAAHVPDLRPRPGEPGQDGHAGQPLPHGHGHAAAPLAAFLRLRQHPQLPLGERPEHVEGLDRPLPMLYRINGGETAAKMLLGRERR